MIGRYAKTTFIYSLPQCLDGFLCDLLRLAHQLTPDFAHLLQLTLRTNCRVCLIARSELANSRHHEHAFRVFLVRAGAGGEDGGLELLEVLWRSEEDELVTRGRGHGG
jgi:hypothetical protein